MRLRTPPEDPYLAGRPDPHISVSRYDLELDYRVATNRLDGRAVIDGVATETVDRVDLSLTGLRVSGVSVNGGKPAKWVHRGDILSVRLLEPLAVGQAFSIEVLYSGSPRPKRGPWGEVGWEELTDGVLVAGQPDGAPSWFPCHDHPSDKASYRLTVTTESAYTVVCNGRLESHRARAGRSVWVYEQDAPMATYLATVHIGRYESLTLGSGPVQQRIIAPPAVRAHAERAFARQPQMFTLFEDRFGPYPFEDYSVIVADDDLEIPLEAQGLSLFGLNHLDGASERLIAHELAHQWFGNSLTVSHWKDIWLHEGFACYAEWLWSEEGGAQSADAQARAAHARLATLDQDIIVADPGPDLMFDDRLYKRAAVTLHALRIGMGDEQFFGLLHTWVARHRHGSVDADGFMTQAEAASRRPLRDFFAEWLERGPLPELPPMIR